METLFRVPLRIFVADLERRLRNETQAAPLKIWPQLEYFRHRPKRRMIAFPWNHALVLIFDLSFAAVELAQNHQDGLQHVQRLKTRYHHRLPLVEGNPFIGPAANDGGNMSRSDKRVQPH